MPPRQPRESNKSLHARLALSCFGIENDLVKAKKKSAPTKPRVHTSREDRARTNAGKTANSKLRSEGRTLAAQARTAKNKRGYLAKQTKKARR